MAQPIPLPTSSGAVTIHSTPGYTEITGLALAETGGSNSVTVVIRQGSATGNVLVAKTIAAGAGDTVSLNRPVKCNGTPYAVISGSGTLAGTIHIA
jgi:hypothetical protein